MDENEIVETYSLDMEGNTLTSVDLDYILDTLRTEFENNEELEFQISKEKKYSYKELNQLPDFNGF